MSELQRRYLDFGVHRPPGGEPLLWPVKVWKILYHAEMGLRLNAFQKAILGLVRADRMGTAEIASLLGLHQDLVSFIIATQLIPNGWMTSGGRLTDKGREVLEVSPDQSIQKRIAYVYQDRLSGRWFPRVSERLSEIEPIRTNEKGFPVFRKSRDSGREISPFLLRPRFSGQMSMGMSAPAWSDLDDALERYRSDQAMSQRLGFSDRQLISLRYQERMEESGVDMWIWAWVFPDRDGDEPFLVADPFGLSPAVSWLRKPLQERLSGDKGLRSYVSRVMGGEASTEPDADQQKKISDEVDLRMMADHAWLQGIPEIGSYFRSVMRLQIRLSRQDKSSPEDWRSLLIETNNLAESVLRWLLKKYPPDIEKLPYPKQYWSGAEAERYLKVIRLDCMTDSVIARLSSQKLRDVREAIRTGNSAIRALIFANYLAASDHDRHPFRMKSRESLALDDLIDMVNLRNRTGAHAWNGSVDEDRIMKFSEFLIQWVQVFKG
ncbi:MAG: hypothetical protein Q4B17_10750 [Lautropia sp.]|nr:hypothetical protein [Lautropia sp.]